MSCICQECGKTYQVDLIFPDHIWEKIKPKGKGKGAGLLCGSCMLAKIENFGKHGVLHVREDFRI